MRIGSVIVLERPAQYFNGNIHAVLEVARQFFLSVSVDMDTHFKTTESITDFLQGEKKEGPTIGVCADVLFRQLTLSSIAVSTSRSF
jgi:hypothetical protein